MKTIFAIFAPAILLALLAVACAKALTDATVQPGNSVSPVYVLDAVTGKCVELSGEGEGFRMTLAVPAACQPLASR